MSAFTPNEIDYLRSQGLARLATVGPDGQPHVVPVTFVFNAEEDAIDIGGVGFGATKKRRDAQANPRVTLLLDDVLPDPRRALALEVRGRAEALPTGGATINPRFPNFAEEFLRLRPTRIVRRGLGEGDGTTPPTSACRRGRSRRRRITVAGGRAPSRGGSGCSTASPWSGSTWARRCSGSATAGRGRPCCCCTATRART